MLSPCQNQPRCHRVLYDNPVNFTYVHLDFNTYLALLYHHQICYSRRLRSEQILVKCQIFYRILLDLGASSHFIKAHLINPTPCKLWKAKRFHGRKKIVDNTHVPFHKTRINSRIRCCLVNTFHFVNHLISVGPPFLIEGHFICDILLGGDCGSSEDRKVGLIIPRPT